MVWEKFSLKLGGINGNITFIIKQQFNLMECSNYCLIKQNHIKACKRIKAIYFIKAINTAIIKAFIDVLIKAMNKPAIKAMRTSVIDLLMKLSLVK